MVFANLNIDEGDAASKINMHFLKASIFPCIPHHACHFSDAPGNTIDPHHHAERLTSGHGASGP
jgi:hypothetical protein